MMNGRRSRQPRLVSSANVRVAGKVICLTGSFADPADGPAFFVICFACIPSLIMGIWIEMAYQAPYWVHVFTTLPFLLLTCIPPLRPMKGWLIASQYYYKATEGKRVAEEK
jgi:uncharacterized protein (DUF983 family)